MQNSVPIKSHRLHILTPLSAQEPALLAGNAATDGDLIADLRRFPPCVYQVRADGACQDVTDSLLQPPDYWTIAREWLIQFTAQTGLQDILAVDGYGFWWTLSSQGFVPGLTELGDSFAWVDYLGAIRQRERPGAINVYGKHDSIVHLVEQIFPETAPVVFETTSQAKKAQWSRSIGLLVARTLLGIIYLIYSLIRRPDICFFSGTGPLRPGLGANKKLRDIVLGDVAQALQARGWRVVFVEKHGWNASWDRLFARGFFFPNDVVFLLSTPVLHRLGVARKWRKKWSQVQPSIMPHLRYQGYDMTRLFLPLVTWQFTHQAPGVEVMVKMWRRILALWRPRLLYFNNAYGRSAVPAIIAAKTLNMPTIEQQHGVIGRNHICYLVPRQIGTQSSFPLCDNMLVWGKYMQRLLVQAGVYETDQAVVCGFPRIDSLLGELPPRSETLDRLDVPPDAKVVLYTSNEFAGAFFSEILDSIASVSNDDQVYWIIKLHQREGTRSIWEKKVEQRGLQNVRIIRREMDFYALLAACDVHVSFASTTLIEAAILGKPNLGLDIPHTSDPAGYAAAKAFLPIVPNQLGPTACTILHDPLQKDALLKEQKEFAEDWCVHDGKTVDRIVRFIETRIAT